MDAANQNSLAPPAELELLWDPLNAAASETAYRALLPHADDTDENSHVLVEVLTWIARSESFQGKFSEARATLDLADKSLKELDAEPPAAIKIRWLMERGRLYVLERTPAQARSLFGSAWTLANSSGEDSLAVELAQLLAASEPQKTQQEWIMRAISIAEHSVNPKTMQWLGSLYSTLGWKMYDLRQYDKSLELFHRALKSFKTFNNQREAFVAQWSIGKIMRELGKVEDALAIQKNLLAELELAARRDGRVYEELAECLQSLKRTEEAKSYFELAYREMSSNEWIADNQPVKLRRMKDLGMVKNSAVKTP